MTRVCTRTLCQRKKSSGFMERASRRVLMQVLGFKELELPEKFGPFQVVWLELPPSYALHLIERDPKSRLPESPFVVPNDAK
jgi:hypothetical protein